MDTRKILTLFLVLIIHEAHFSPTDDLSTSSAEKADAINVEKKVENLSHSKIYKLEITSQISNAYARTAVVSKVKNVANKTQETSFTFILPDTAFVSGFIMEIDGKNYTGVVKDKEEASNVYKQAVESGLAAAHVTTRDSNQFTVSVNIEPEAKATFYLIYEEFLKRRNGKYEQIINIYPKQLVEDMSVTVTINESKKIKYVKTLPIQSGNEIGSDNEELDPRADIELINETMAVVKFSPNVEKQKQVADILKTEGFGGQFVVEYDVDRDSSGGEILIRDGYFVHFFNPSEAKHIPRHVVFVLDTSASMEGQKIQQLKDAMLKILDELHDDDLFSLVVFSTYVHVLNIDDKDSNGLYPSISRILESSYCAWALTEEHYDTLQNYRFPKAYVADKENIKKAKEIIRTLGAYGGTDILSALNVGLHLARLEKHQKKNIRPMVIFLTDGEPTIRQTSTNEILEKITTLNAALDEALLFTLSFGDEADKTFLQRLALDNSGFSRHIYEAADASLQLQDFYKQVSSLLLLNVEFKYVPEVTSLTKTQFPAHFDGSELVVAGLSNTENMQGSTVNALGINGNTSLVPSVHPTITNIERLWAYLTIKQLVEKMEALYDTTLRKKVVDLALKYSFVTPVTSLVVVRPYDSVAYNDDADSANGHTTPPPAIIRTTPFCRELYEPRTFHSDVLTAVPWINNTLNQDGLIKLEKGVYKLGLNETTTDDISCPNTPLDTPGRCKLLHSCATVFTFLESVDDFVKYSCMLKDGFIGICCPETDVHK